MMQPREKCAVLIGKTNEWIELLLERQVNANADGAMQCFWIDRQRAFIRGLHDAGTAAADNVAAHSRQLGRKLLHAIIRARGGLKPRRAEDCDAIILTRRSAEPR